MNTAAIKPVNWPLALTILGGVGLVISFLSPVFTTNTRWLLVFVLLVAMLLQRQPLSWLKSGTGVWILACLIWSLLTSFWSDVPQLTLMKGVAFVMVVTALISGGISWLQHNPISRALSFLFPLMVVAILAGVLGRNVEANYDQGAGMVLYRGMTSGSNMFGSLMVMISPLLLWKLYLTKTMPRARLVWAILLTMTIAFLLMSVSRASILAFCLIVAGFGLAFQLRTRARVFFLGGTAAVILVALSPGILETIEQKYVRKNMLVQDASIFYTRETPWEISWRMAQEGGWFGVGYGVSADGGEFDGGLTAVGYGREKGNTQLAIVEETGIIGLAIYVCLLISLFRRLAWTFLRERDRDTKVLLGIVSGALAALTASGVFEAWWVAPGSPESIWFWAMVGVALGLCRAAERRLNTPKTNTNRYIAHPMPANA